MQLLFINSLFVLKQIINKYLDRNNLLGFAKCHILG